MSLFVIAEVKDLDGEFLGYVVVKEGTKKLEDSNLWTEDESNALRDHVADLNNRIQLQAHWPDANDPDVQELVNDPDFEPLKYEVVQVVDQDAVEQMVDQNHLRVVEDADGYTVIHPEDIDRVPTYQDRRLVDPSAPMERFRKAAEIVAKRRAGQV